MTQQKQNAAFEAWIHEEFGEPPIRLTMQARKIGLMAWQAPHDRHQRGEPAASNQPDEELSSACLDCGGTGLRDSGGIYPWGEAAMIPCDCGAAPQPAEPTIRNFRTVAEPVKVPSVPEYTSSIGHAGQAYLDTFKGAHPLPSQFRWADLWMDMCKAAATPPAGPKLPDPLRLNDCQNQNCGRFNGPRSVECRAMADNACARNAQQTGEQHV